MRIVKNGRVVENVPLILSVLRDSSWCYAWVWVGTVAVVPIITYQVYVIWKARKDAHAAAQGVISGILLCANTVWMFGDFFFGHDQLRNVARWVFTIGMVLGLLFFLYILRKDSSGEMHHQVIRAQLYKHHMTLYRLRRMEDVRRHHQDK